MTIGGFRLQTLGEAGGWRRLFVAGAALLAVASLAWAWQGELQGRAFLEYVMSVWAIGAAGLALLLAGLAALDCGCVWVGRGFGLPPAGMRAGTAAVLAGLTFLGAVALHTRYETVMPAGGVYRTGELCVVLDRWRGEAKPCTEEAVIRKERRRPQPQQAEAPRRAEAVWQRIVAMVLEFIDVRWLQGMTGRL